MSNTIEKFWKKVNKGRSCWNWMGHCQSSGYGQFRLSGSNDLVHRIVWRYYHGMIPGNMFVLHTCDNRRCVNPCHLFLGTQKDNMLDKTQKGRAKGKIMYGESNPASKLTKRQARYIRHFRRNGWTLKELSDKYSVSIATVHRIINYVTWRSA